MFEQRQRYCNGLGGANNIITSLNLGVRHSHSSCQREQEVGRTFFVFDIRAIVKKVDVIYFEQNAN